MRTEVAGCGPVPRFTAKLWQSRERSNLYDEYETYATTRGSSNNVSLFIHHIIVNTRTCAFAGNSIVVSHDVLTYASEFSTL